ncbi:hypothetical protein [Jeongeupia chitinilytica]|uniref:Polymerase nucleotidyl transferase domain-containing protein n=1 Tax=Jeongeupia chitinilytica TaxID=1041641 RepID=A0ABQ3H420_9NEIS|nr:hypothetical protein [Jeongeupia chitinilytica]GHD66334.1 hypothetical protein GCM10007350_28390 [Jeongeupia chitinilytica]
MPRNALSERHMAAHRAQIAHRAAKLIAEDHLHDFALAKKKAARQLGLDDQALLPSNQEVESALASYRAIYQPQHAGHLQALRLAAAEVMRQLEPFTPYLTGSVLSGVAGPHSDINLIAYVDDPKSVELYLLNRGIEYRPVETSLRHDDYPTLQFDHDGIAIRLSVRPRNAERAQVRGEERARLEQLRRLIDDARQLAAFNL